MPVEVQTRGRARRFVSRHPGTFSVSLVVAVGLVLVLFPVDPPRQSVAPREIHRPTGLDGGTSALDSKDEGPPASVSTVESEREGAAVPTDAVDALPTSGASAPKVGRYVYEDIREFRGEEERSALSWLVHHVEADPSEAVVQFTSAEGAAGTPTASSSSAVERWTPAAVERLERGFPEASNGRSRRCSLDPPLLKYPFPLEVGLKWESESWCGQDRERTKESLAGDVIGIENVRVAGTDFFAFVVQVKTGGGLPGYMWFVEESTLWFSPELGVVVKSEEVRQETVWGGQERQRRTALISWPGRQDS